MSVMLKVLLVSMVVAGVATGSRGLATAADGEAVYSQTQAIIPSAIARSMHKSFR